MTFLNEVYDRAQEEQILLGTYSGDNIRKTETTTTGFNTLKVDDSEVSDSSINSDSNGSNSKQIKEHLKCPVCSQPHSFLNKRNGQRYNL